MWLEAFSDPGPAAVRGTVLGVGLDLVRVGRVARLLDAHGEALLRRVLHPNELGAGDGLGRSPGSLATVLAAKEAFFKALGDGVAGPLDWSQVEVSVNGAESLTPRGPALDAIYARGITDILFTHGAAADVRVAVAILWRGDHGRSHWARREADPDVRRNLRRGSADFSGDP